MQSSDFRAALWLARIQPGRHPSNVEGVAMSETQNETNGATAASQHHVKPPPYAVVRFETWDAFKGGVRSALPGTHDDDVYKRFIFRGQGSSDWSLRSTFDRSYSDVQAASRDTLAKQLISEFYDECERFAPWRYSMTDP